MANEFVWFVWALAVTISNVVFSVLVYYNLKMKKIDKKKVVSLRDISMFYSVGMMFVIIFAVILFLVSAGFVFWA